MSEHPKIELTPARLAALLGALFALLAVTVIVTLWITRTGGPGVEPRAAEHDDHGEGEHEEGERGEAEHAKGEARVVALTEAAVELAEIQTEAVVRGKISVGTDVPAEVQLNPERVAHVSSLVSGQLRKIEVSLGDRVKAGQKLAVVRSVEFGEARAALPKAQAAHEVAKSSFERQKKLRTEGIASERSFLDARAELRQARALLDAARAGLSVFGSGAAGGAEFSLLSPIDGIITSRHATFGESIDPDDTLFEVADLGLVWVVGRVYEQDIAAALVGAPVLFRTHAYPSKTWTGTLSYVASTLDETTRTLEIRMELDNDDGALKPGMFARLTLASDAKKDALTVPVAAVQTHGGETIVFFDQGGGRFERREVELGIVSPAAVEVVGGLDETDKVVTQGSFILKSELEKESFEAGHAH
ncbi:MAG: hypothetical protein DRI90_22495 [Deltaproteobacteria bacterium]|nr:MAG: hypothetical protein DRI90_22495 [Deltaproteobacteria bacterium]